MDRLTAAKPCAHCSGTGQCRLVCCWAFGNAVRHGDGVIYVCMLCRGTGLERQPGTRRAAR